MGWGRKKPEEKPMIERVKQEVVAEDDDEDKDILDDDDELDNIEEEKARLESRMKRLDEKRKAQPTVPNKQELIDAAQGNINRAMQLLEILRRM